MGASQVDPCLSSSRLSHTWENESRAGLKTSQQLPFRDCDTDAGECYDPQGKIHIAKHNSIVVSLSFSKFRT